MSKCQPPAWSTSGMPPNLPGLGGAWGRLAVAALGGRLSAETVLQLANESSGPVGRLLGTPVDGDDATISKLRDDVAKARGRMVFLESGDWSNAGGGAMAVAETHRYGAEPPQSLVNLQEVATREVVMACGLNSGLWHDLGAATATGSVSAGAYSAL